MNPFNFSRTHHMKKFLSLPAFLILCWTSSNLYAQMKRVYTDADENNHINGISFYTPSEGYIAFEKWIGFTQDGGSSFTRKYITLANVNYNGQSVNLTFGFAINGVHAFSKDTLMVYGHYGFKPAILYSVDQGNSFSLVYHFALNASRLYNGVTAMVFPDHSAVGYAVVEDQVLKTNNKGLNWSSVYYETGADFFQLDFPSGSTGYVLGTTKLLKTMNGGAAWQALSKPTGTLLSASFINERTGWLNARGGGAGYVYKTANGGATWIPQNEPDFYNIQSSLMHFVNDSTGYAVAAGFEIIKTGNQGKVWESIERDNRYDYLNYTFQALYFLDENTFWAGGGHGFLEYTANGGGATLPRALFSVDLSQLANSGKVQLINKSKTGSGYQWFTNRVPFSTDYNASYSSNRLSIDTVKLVVTKSGRTDTAQSIVDTRLNPHQCFAGFTVAVDTGTVRCVPGDTAYGVRHYWYFGDGNADSSQVRPVYTYGRIGDYTIKHVVYNTVDKCKDSSIQAISIIRTRKCLVLDFTYTADTFFTNQVKAVLSYSNTSEPGNSSLDAINWNWGDGTSSQSGGVYTTTHAYNAPGFYTVCVNATNRYTGCVSAVCKPVRVEMDTACNADFLIQMQLQSMTFSGKPPAIKTGKRNTWIVSGRAPAVTGNTSTYQASFFTRNTDGTDNYFNAGGNTCGYLYTLETCLDSLNRSMKHIVYDSVTGCTDQVEKGFRVPTRMNLFIKAVPNPTAPNIVSFYAYQVGTYGDTIPYSSRWRVTGPGTTYYEGGYTGVYNRMSYTFTQSGVFSIAIAASECFGFAREVYYINYPVYIDPCTVYPFDFTTASSSLGANTVTFSINSPNLNEASKGTWYFGDSTNFSAAFSPIAHPYKAPGMYTARLKYVSYAGCTKEVSKLVNVQIPCGSKLYIEPGAYGTSYQWEVDTGAGFQKLPNDPRYSLSSSGGLIIASAPASFLSE